MLCIKTTEKCIEIQLKKAIEKAGGFAWKFNSSSRRGVPDRIVFMPGGRIWFVELKAPGKRPTLLQIKRKNQIEAMGFRVRIIDCLEEVDRFMEEVMQK